MAGRVANGAELSKQSWNALRQHPQLLIFPLISGLVMLGLTVFFFVSLAASGVLSSLAGSASAGREMATSQSVTGLVLTFIYYLISYTVIIFSNTALVGATLKLMRGEPATVSDGFAIASARFGKIVFYALISATVGMIARGISQSGRESKNLVVMLIAAILGGIIQGAWNLLVFFAIPVIVIEDIGVLASLSRSLELFRHTWGESFVGSAVISGASCLVYVALFTVAGLLIAAGVAANSVALIVGTIILLILALVALSLVTGAVNGVFQASMYRYATTGDAGPFISSEYANAAFLKQ